MNDSLTLLPAPVLLTPVETIARLGVSFNFLAQLRAYRKGPAFVYLLGWLVRYPAEGVEAWANRVRVAEESE